MNLNTKQLIIRSIIFIAVLFITRSIKDLILFLFEAENKFNYILPTEFLYKWNLLKAFAIILIVFILYNKDSLEKLAFPKKLQYSQAIKYFILANIVLLIYYAQAYLLKNIITHPSLYTLIIITSLCCLGIYVFLLAIAFFTKSYLEKLYTTYKKQVLFFAILFLLSLTAFVLFTKTWLFFSTIITIILALLFQPFYPTQFRFLENGPQMTVADFSVSIGEPCSGIDSMLLFIAFYLAILALDFKKINKKNAILFFVLGFIGVYVVNILRLFLLMLVGIHISPELAVGLFHTNAGWLLFVIYFLIFYGVTKKKLYKKS